MEQRLKPLLKPDEAADLMEISKNVLTTLRKSGRIAYYHFTRKTHRYEREECLRVKALLKQEATDA